VGWITREHVLHGVLMPHGKGGALLRVSGVGCGVGWVTREHVLHGVLMPHGKGGALLRVFG